LFELLQQQDGPRQGRGSGSGRPGSLGQPPESQKGGNGQAHGAVESKPNGQTKPSTIEDLSATPATKPAEAKPSPKPAPKPQDQPKPEKAKPAPVAEPEGSEKPERPAGAADWSGMHPKSAVRVRLIWVYGAIAAVIAVVVAAWAISYSLAENKWKGQFEELLQRSDASAPIQDPIEVDRGTVAQGDPPPLSRIEQPTRQSEEPRVVPDPPVEEPRTRPAPPIDVTVDVRQAGNNYMKLASGMTAERATGLARHLTDNGVPAMALDEGRGGWGLYTAYAVPSGQFSATGQQRSELERRVYQLLPTTPRELGGPYTPRDHLWVRFDG
jgi:hypothetical protein